MTDIEHSKIAVLGRCHLIRSALEQIVSALQLRYVTAENASDLVDDVDVVLIAFASTQGVLAEIASCVERPTPPRIVLYPQDPDLLEALPSLPSAVAAIVQPGMGVGEIEAVISLVAEGHRIVPFAPKAGTVAHNGADTTAIAPGVLTNRQLEILGEVAKGQTNKAIARSLDISINTVEAHVSRIIRKLNVDNRTQAALALRGSVPSAHPPCATAPSEPAAPIRPAQSASPLTANRPTADVETFKLVSL